MTALVLAALLATPTAAEPPRYVGAPGLGHLSWGMTAAEVQDRVPGFHWISAPDAAGTGTAGAQLAVAGRPAGCTFRFARGRLEEVLARFRAPKPEAAVDAFAELSRCLMDRLGHPRYRWVARPDRGPERLRGDAGTETWQGETSLVRHHAGFVDGARLVHQLLVRDRRAPDPRDATAADALLPELDQGGAARGPAAH